MTYEALERSIGTRQTRYANAEPHLFPSTKPTLRELLAMGDTICIWSNTYTSHLATAGIGELRRELPQEERGRIIISTGDAKLERLPLLFDHVQSSNCTTLAIVDDNEDNLVKAQQFTGDKAIFVRSDEAARERTLQPPTDPSHLTIVDFKELLTIRQQLIDTPVFWVVDFNDTLIDTRAFIDTQLQQAKRRQA
jgi:FMN phosphatase YigB (HAD superfamily)